MNHFSPHLEILPAPQRALWNELSEVSREFVLYRGTALALHLAHRKSVDFDLFGSRALDLAQIEQGVSFLKGANVIQRDKNTLSAITLKALSFFDDGDLTLLPEDIKLRLAMAAREVDLDHLPGIDKFSRQIDQDRGYEL